MTEQESINHLLEQLVDTLGTDGIYSLACKHVKSAENAEKDLMRIAGEIAMSFSLAGFYAGFNYACKNVVGKEENCEEENL